MCLDTISAKKPESEGVGWKIFDICKGKLCGELLNRHKARPVNKWLKAKDFRTQYVSEFSSHPPYRLDWHIFKTRYAAEQWQDDDYAKIMKVKYRKAHTEGRLNLLGGSWLKVIVADEIYIKEDDNANL